MIDEFGLDEENDDMNNIQDQSTDETLFEYPDDADSDDDDVLNSTKSEFNGIRIRDVHRCATVSGSVPPRRCISIDSSATMDISDKNS